MNIHGCAKSCPASRLLLVERVRKDGWQVEAAAHSVGLSSRSGFKWLRRFREEGLAGLVDRSSRPRRSPRRTCERRVQTILELRRLRWSGPMIAEKLKMAVSTVSRVLVRHGLSRIKSLEPKEPVRRYEHSAPGDLLHVDIKRLARFERPGHRVTGDRRSQPRGAGYEYAHVAIDDFSRLAYVEVLANEQGATAVRFLERALRWFRQQGVRVKRVLSDNGSCYRATAFAELCEQRDIKHSFTRPYRPQTNGKAERFIQTMLREWVYVRAYRSHRDRNGQLARWLRRYNFRRPHGSLGRKPPASRLSKGQAEQRD